MTNKEVDWKSNQDPIHCQRCGRHFGYMDNEWTLTGVFYCKTCYGKLRN